MLVISENQLERFGFARLRPGKGGTLGKRENSGFPGRDRSRLWFGVVSISVLCFIVDCVWMVIADFFDDIDSYFYC